MEGQKARKKQTNTPPEGLLDAISAGSVAAAEMKKIRLVPYYKRITCLNIGKGTDEGRKDYRTVGSGWYNLSNWKFRKLEECVFMMPFM